jgi:predicted membrane protein
MTKRALESLSAGIILIGMGILFLVPGLSFWPWILAVIGFAGLPASLANQKGWLGWQSFFWLVGLAILFALNALWPGILILIGISTILGALTRDSEGSPFAREPEGAGEPFAVEDDD